MARTLSIKIIVFTSVLFLSGCMFITRADVRSIHCAGWAAIYLTDHDLHAISKDLARQLLRHNKFGAKACHWGR